MYDFFTIGVSVAGDKNDLYVCAPGIKLNRHICRNLPESFGASGKSSSQLGNQ